MEIFENDCKDTTEINEVVYANSCWHTAEMCEIVDFVKNESSTHKNVYKLHSLSFGGNFAITEDYVFRTRKEALDAAEKERQTAIENYKQEIKDINDLIRFPLKHCFHGDEYTDENAVCAYKIRAKELTGTPIRNENIMNKPLGNYMLISTDGVSLDDYSFFTSLEKARDTMELAYKSKLNLITNRLGHRPDDYKIHDNEAWIYSEEYGRTVWNIIKIVE